MVRSLQSVFFFFFYSIRIIECHHTYSFIVSFMRRLMIFLCQMIMILPLFCMHKIDICEMCYDRFITKGQLLHVNKLNPIPRDPTAHAFQPFVLHTPPRAQS